MKDVIRSFGAQLAVYLFLTPFEIQNMQALDKWHYSKGITRCQVKWSFGQRYFVFTDFYDGEKSLFRLDKVTNHVDCIDRTANLEIRRHVIVMIENDLLLFEFATMDVFKYSNVFFRPVKQFLASGDFYRLFFAISAYDGKHVFITGGHDSDSTLKAVNCFSLSNNTFTPKANL